MIWLATVAGSALIVIVMRDIFHTLGHPQGQGSISHFVLRGAWRLSRRRGEIGHIARIAGPLSLLAVITVWGMLAVIGWALVYLPAVPTGFIYTGVVPSAGGDIFESLYISMVTISTLGFGDIVPASVWLRIVAPLEALFGFALLTAAVSWVLQIYPALTRRRVLAIRLSMLRRANAIATFHDPESAKYLSVTLDALSVAIVQAGVDLRTYSETYYFRDSDPNASLPAMLMYAVELGRVGATTPTADVRLAATLLNYALEELAVVLRVRFRHLGETVPDVFKAYAADHGHPLE